MLPPTLVACTITAATVALHFRDPHEQGSWGLCPSAAMGFWCPGCGGLRAVNDLTNGQVLEAASSNLYFIALLPLIGYAFLRWSTGQWTGRTWSPAGRTVNLTTTALIVVLVVFTVVRNLPMGAWLAP